MRADDIPALWSPILNAGEENIDNPNRERGTVRNMSTKNLLINYLEDDGNQFWQEREEPWISA